MEEKYVEIITGLPIDRTFQYKVPAGARFNPEVGKRVYIPFRNMKRVGYIVKIEDKPMVEYPRDLIDVIDEEPIFSSDMIQLAGWIKDNYFCSWGEALEAMIPGALKHGKVSMQTRVKEEPPTVIATDPHEPNREQQVVLDSVMKCLEEKRHEVFLLHGITGSGKTEIYLQTAQRVVSKGKSGVILVPEISLTPQTVESFKSRFGEKVAVFHSKMLESARFSEWKKIKSGEAKIVVGPRSAVFSPFKDPGIFIIDEEHEPSYKQDDVPRYHAREVAIERARMAGIPVILGSATPSLESYHKALKGEYRLVELTQRIKEKELPRVKLVDMRMEMDTRTGRRVISSVMGEALKTDVNKGQQGLIFINRRGFSTFVVCRGCGFVLKCKKCDAPLVYHEPRKELLCHHCGYKESPVNICPSCNGEYLMYKGTGTQKVEGEIRKIIPNSRVERMDSDTMSKRGSHDRLLSDFKQHKIDVIVGTQMIAKGFDFPKVTLVGVVSADANLNLPDFRSGERTFNLITQVAGRAGRGDLGGEVVVQTFTPDNYAIKMAAKHDYAAFYSHEIQSRRELGFPPFKNLVKLTIRSKKEENVIKFSENLAKTLKKKIPDIDMIGPVPSPMVKLRGFYRWNILVRCSSRTEIVEKLRAALKGFRKASGVFMAVDVDPMSL
jgi:primosomal protein N' (replication factor Y) (superfamily II helicase)